MKRSSPMPAVYALMAVSFFMGGMIGIGYAVNEPEPQTAHWIVDPETGHSEMICR